MDIPVRVANGVHESFKDVVTSVVRELWESQQDRPCLRSRLGEAVVGINGLGPRPCHLRLFGIVECWGDYPRCPKCAQEEHERNGRAS